MAKGIFTTRVSPEYDDIPEIRYHFPKTYLNYVEKTEGDWIIYYEPRRGGGRMGYFAMAQVERIEPDKQRPNHFFAYVINFVEFPNQVPFKLGGQCIESALNKPDGSVNRGAFGRAVRLVSEDEFNFILSVGFQGKASLFDAQAEAVEEEIAIFERPILQQVVERPFRDILFAKQVRNAYDGTCAMTGLKLINGGGRCEIEAAHIRPVGSGHNGPDSIRNGIALSRTFHWMFDRGVVSLTDDYQILLAEKLISDQVRRMINPSGSILLPESKLARPHRQFLQYHRNNIFKTR